MCFAFLSEKKISRIQACGASGSACGQRHPLHGTIEHYQGSVHRLITQKSDSQEAGLKAYNLARLRKRSSQDRSMVELMSRS